jgi:HEAT repeat protein
MLDLRQRVQRILDKLRQVRARGLSCFGSDSHQFRLNAPATEAELRAFEAEHDIRLPADYRAFLLYAGNGGPGHGGAGPYYGLYPLDHWDDFTSGVVDDGPADLLSRPCPLHPDLTADDWTRGFAAESPYQGTMSLGTMGCGGMMQLVVTGPFAGRVVYVEAEGKPPYMVHEPDFLAWYERWLDELLAGCKITFFGVGPGGGEDAFFRILDDPHATDAAKAEAARAFGRLPRLSDTAAGRVLNFLDYPAADVRAGVCATVREFQIPAAGEATAQRLHDVSPAVRREAVRAVMAIDPGRWSPAVLLRLRDDMDEALVTTAFFELDKAGKLSKPELLRIIERSPLGNLRYLAANKVPWADGDRALLGRMLHDPHDRVRVYAILGLRQLKARDRLPDVLDLLRREKDALVIEAALNLFKELGDASVVPVLLEHARSKDDFHRLAAIEALSAIGDERAVPIAVAMLCEQLPPVRRDANGFPGQTSAYRISDLVRKALKESPNRALRRLAN